MAMAMTVTVRSISRNATCPINYHLVTPGYTPQQKAALVAATSLERGDTVEFVQLTESFTNLHAGRDGSAAYYYRLALPKLLLTRERVLYVDSDLIVRGDLAPLWALVEASKAPALAALDYEKTIDETVLPVYREYGLTTKSPYFNSGVLGMNLATWRKEGITEQIIAFLVKHGGVCPAWDQAPINALLSSRIELLPEIWNALLPNATPAAQVVHFSNWRKPFGVPGKFFSRQNWKLAAWHSAMADNRFYREFFEVLDDTAYKGWRPRSLSLTVMKLIPGSLLQSARAYRRMRSLRVHTPL